MQNKKNTADRLFAVLMGGAYLLAGLLWVALSDQAGSLLFASADALARFQTWKGFAFVALSAVVVYLMAARGSRRVDPMRVGGGAGLSALLTGLVLVTAAPLVILLGFNILQQTRHNVDDANALVAAVAGATGSEVGTFLRESTRLAEALGRRPLVRALDADRCDPLLAELAALKEEFHNIAVLDAAGNLVCAAHPTLHVPVPPGALAAGPHLSAPLKTEAGLALALTSPMRGSGNEPMASVQLLIATEAFERLVAAGAPPGVASSLMTQDGHLLARSPTLPGLVGQQLPEIARFIEGLRRGDDSVVARGVDGRERFYALRAVPGTTLVAVAGVEVGQAFGPLRVSALRSFGVAAMALLVATVLISAIMRRISNPMKDLARAAEAVAAGQFDHRAPETGPREVAGVAAQFNRMLDRLPALERALRDSEMRHRTLLEKLSHNIPGVLFQMRLTPSGRVFFPFASQRLERMFEVTQAQAASDAAAVLERIHPEDRDAVEAAVRASAEGLRDLVREYRVLLPSGGVRHYLTSAQPESLGVCDILWYGCTVDVSPLKEAQQALQEANEQLEARVARRTRELAAANESLESFSFSVAHDLRAPLHAIEGFTQALPELLGERNDPERVQRLVQRIVANTTQMGRMIDGLLEVARAGKGRFEERELQLGEMVASVLAELELPAGAEVDVAPLPAVRADTVTLRQVWWNLLANAVKFSGHRSEARIAVDWQRQGNELVFSVRDNGAGFDPQFAGRLFTAFQRLHDAHEFEGTGIGLALTRRIVERHGGRMWAQGQPDAGATFYFSLPVGRLVEGPDAERNFNAE